jgi:thiol-disulfide isomerase/thioredoxin
MKFFLVALLFLLTTSSLFAESNLPDRPMETVNSKYKIPKVEYFDGSKLVNIQEGKPTFILLNFWATWCPACVAEMSSLDALAKKEAGKNLKVIAVNVNEGGPSEVKSFLTKFKPKKMIILYDSNNKSSKEFAIRGLPTTFLISPEGEVLAKLEGSTNWDAPKIRSQIEKYVAKSQ